MTTLDEIKDKLAKWFPPAEHKERKLQGGGKWFFLSHQVIRDRLNEVCYGYWEEKYSHPLIAGDYVVIQCELTICGVTRTGIADNKTFPETNDEGKAKIIGSPVVNAARHAFRDAAEKFGIGAYLDEQKSSRDKFVNYMHKRGDGRAYKAAYDNGWVEGKGKPQPQAQVGQPPTPKKKYPEHNAIVKAVRAETGHQPNEITAFCKANYQCASPDELTPIQLEGLIKALAVGWADNRFQSPELAATAYDGHTATRIVAGQSLQEAVLSWIEKVQSVQV